MCTVLLPPGVNPIAVNKYIIYHSRNHCCHGNATVRSPFIADDADVVINNIKVFRVATEIQQWVPSTLCRATKHFVLLLITIRIKVFVCVYPFLSYPACSLHLSALNYIAIRCLALPYFYIIS